MMYDLLVIHDGVENFVNRVQNVHGEWTFVVFVLLLGPFLCFGIEEVLTPQSVHEFDNVDFEFFGVHFGELFECKGPTVQSGTETYGTFTRVNLSEKQYGLLNFSNTAVTFFKVKTKIIYFLFWKMFHCRKLLQIWCNSQQGKIWVLSSSHWNHLVYYRY